MADIRRTLPPFVSRGRVMGTLLDSINGELEQLEQEARAAACRMAAGTADEAGMALWEAELGLEQREDLPLEGRRALVLAALGQRGACTPEKLRAAVRRMMEGEITLTEDTAGQSVAVRVSSARLLVPSLRAVGAALRRAVPAHLDCTLAAETSMTGEAGVGRVLHQSIHLAVWSTDQETEENG